MTMLNKNTSKTGLQESVNEYFKWINEDCTEALKLVKAPVVAINSGFQNPPNAEAFR